jgi:hypothetical protein
MTILDRRRDALPVFTPRESRPGRALEPSGLVETGVALAIAACVVVVHDVPFLLRTPYWLDEAWVAVSTRVPVSHLRFDTSSSPIGWTFLLRLAPAPGQQDQRLVPLLFAALTVVAAYAFGRSLRLLPVVTGLLAGGAALLVPAMLVSNELKQYTADAFVTMLGLVLLSRLEADWSRRRLAELSGALMVAAFFSHVAIFVAAAALPCAVVVQVVRRHWAESAEAAVATMVTGAVVGVIFLLFDGGTQTAQLRNYWNAFYLPHSPAAAIRYLNKGLHQLLPYFGIDHLALLAALVALGLVTLAWQGRWATALLLPVLALEMLVLGALHKYPLLDQRTSTFFITASVVIAAVGIAGVATLLAQRVHLTAGLAIATAAAILYIFAALPYVDTHNIPVEDVRAQADYVTTHLRPGDAVLVSLGASYGYGYYASPHPQVTSGGVGFAITYPASDRVIALTNRRPVDVQSGLARGLALVAGHPEARLWIVLNHVAPTEQAAWNASLARLSPHTIPVAKATSVIFIGGAGR